MWLLVGMLNNFLRMFQTALLWVTGGWCYCLLLLAWNNQHRWWAEWFRVLWKCCRWQLQLPTTTTTTITPFRCPHWVITLCPSITTSPLTARLVCHFFTLTSKEDVQWLIEVDGHLPVSFFVMVFPFLDGEFCICHMTTYPMCMVLWLIHRLVVQKRRKLRQKHRQAFKNI